MTHPNLQSRQRPFNRILEGTGEVTRPSRGPEFPAARGPFFLTPAMNDRLNQTLPEVRSSHSDVWMGLLFVGRPTTPQGDVEFVDGGDEHRQRRKAVGGRGHKENLQPVIDQKAGNRKEGRKWKRE